MYNILLQNKLNSDVIELFSTTDKDTVINFTLAIQKRKAIILNDITYPLSWWELKIHEGN